jgi:heat shock protein HslJ
MDMRTATKRISTVALVAAALILVTSAYAQNPIEGKWKITSYNFAEKREFPLAQLDVTLTVDRDLHIGGKSGCNIYSGSISLGPGSAMKLGSITSSDMACREIPGSFEGGFLDVLSSASRYEVKGGTLTITDTSTGHFLRFERVGGAVPQSSPKSSQGKHEIFYVSNKTGNCPIIAPLKCLLVKQEKSAQWKEYYDEIIGFKFKPGLFYKIEVKRVGDEPSGLPGDVTVYRHKFVRILKSSVREKDIYR